MARFNFMTYEVNPVAHATGSVYQIKVFNLNNTLNKLYWFFQPPEAVTISHLGFLYSLRFGTPPSYRLSLRLTDENGTPAAEMLTSRVFQPPADTSWDGTFQWVEMLTPYKARRGENLCGVLEYFSGGVNASHASRFGQAISGAMSQKGYFPYSISNSSGVETRDRSQIIFGWKSMTRSYGWPIQAMLLDSVNSPAQVGIRFQFHPAYGRVFKIAGARIQGRMAGGSGKSFDMVLYDEDNVELNRVTFDCDWTLSPSTVDAVIELLFDDATLESLTFGREYVLAFAPNEVDTNFALRTFEVPESLDMTAFPGGTSIFMVSRAVSTDNWTEHPTRRPQVDLLPSEWTE